MENYLYRNAAKACNRKGTRNPGAYKKSRLARHVDQNTHEKNHQIHYERDENVRSPTTCVRKEHRTVGVTRREAKVLKNISEIYQEREAIELVAGAWAGLSFL